LAGPEIGPGSVKERDKMRDRVLGMFCSVAAQIDRALDFGHYDLSAATLPSAAVAGRSHRLKY